MSRPHPALRALRAHLLRRIGSAALVLVAAVMPAWWMNGRWSSTPTPAKALPAAATVAAAGAPALNSFKSGPTRTTGR